MNSCTGCGGTLAPDAEWCLECLTPAGAPAPAPVAVPADTRPAWQRQAEAAGWTPTAPPVVADPWTKANNEAWSASAASFRPPPAYGYDPPPPTSSIGPDAGVGYTVAGILGLGLLLQIVMVTLHVLDRGNSADVVRLNKWLLVGYYALVLVWVVRKATAVGFRPTWTKGRAVEGIVFGAVAGIVECTLVTLLGMWVFGEIRLDQTVSELSDLTFSTLGFVLLITIVAAPFVEELLFRGLIIEAFRHKGLKRAVVVSSVLFALWHWNGALLYFTLGGIVMALVFLRWGLVASMAHHFAFNGTIILLAVVFILGGPGKTLTAENVSFDIPGGWYEVEEPDRLRWTEAQRVRGILGAEGPGGAEVVVEKVTHDVPGGWNADFLLMLVNSIPGFEDPEDRILKETLRPVEYPAGRAAVVEAEFSGEPVKLVVFFKGSDLYYFTFAAWGSKRAEGDFEKMLRSVRLG